MDKKNYIISLYGYSFFFRNHGYILSLSYHLDNKIPINKYFLLFPFSKANSKKKKNAS